MSIVHHARRLAQARPLVLLLDDLQWADEPSLRALRLLARAPADQLFVLGTLRVPEPVSPAIDQLIAELQRRT